MRAPTWPFASALPVLALVAAVLVAYLPALRAGFVWDDDAYVTANTTLRSLDGLRRIWLSPGATPQYYPLTFTSFWLEHQRFGEHPFGYHLVNVLLHAANAVLAWLVLRRLRLPGAWLAAAIFGLHPVHVESVAWITERKNVLSGACYLAALLTALAVAEAPASRRTHAGWVIALFGAALLSKTVTCTLPLVLLILLWWRRGTLTRDDVATALPLFALGAGLALVTVWMERTHVGAVGALFDLSPVERLLIAGRALWFYAATLLWPHPLAFVYPRWTIDAGLFQQWLFPLAAGVALAVAWVTRERNGRGPFTALLAFAVTLAPALGFVDVYPMRYTFVADHYQYLASLFLIAPAAAGLTTAARRLGDTAVRAAPVLAGAGLLALAVLTWRQTLIYADQETLWRDVIAKNPTAALAHINLGMWLHQRGRSEEALTALGDAVALAPNDPEIHGDLGVVLAALGRQALAHRHLEEAVRLAPDSALAHNNLGNVLAADGRLAEAAAQYREAVRLRPSYADAENNLGNVLAETGEVDEAIRRYRDAIAADPAYVDAHYDLAVVLARAGRGDEALDAFRATVALAPAHAEAQRGLGAALAAHQRYDEAIVHLGAATRLAPQKAEAHYQLGVALAALGRTNDAVVALSRAIELRADVPDFHNDLGIAFARRGDGDAAVQEFRKTLALAPEHREARDNLATALAQLGRTP